MSEELCELGVYGLTTLGQSFAAHHASCKTRVCVGDDDPSFTEQVINEYKAQTEVGEDEKDPQRASRCMKPSESIEVMAARLKRPRKIIIFGTHEEDAKFEQIWNVLAQRLEKDDIILRWGKEEANNQRNVQFYNDSIVGNLAKLQASTMGIHMLEMVRMEKDRAAMYQGETPDFYSVGGPAEAFTELEQFLSPLVSVGHVGSEASCAHYAHMIQRTIENCVAQALAEGADIMQSAAGYDNQDIGRMMNKWDQGGGLLTSYLVKISSKIFYKRDSITDKGFTVDYIRDSLDLNAVDTWVTLEATKFGIPVPTVNATLEARFFSVMKSERVEASEILSVPDGPDTPSVLKDQIGEDLQCAIYCACMCIIAECLSIFQAAAEVESWEVNFAECIKLWNHPGSFLESTLMEKVHSALSKSDEEMKNLLLLPSIALELKELHVSWRRIVSLSFASAIPCPTLSSSLTYYDTYRARKLPVGLIRAQRDFFDASGYDRVGGGEGWFSTCWVKEHTAKKKKEATAAEGNDAEPPKKRKRKKKSKDT